MNEKESELSELELGCSIWIDFLKKSFQDEYDRHAISYRRGCRGCINSVWAIRDLAKKLGIPLKEQGL